MTEDEKFGKETGRSNEGDSAQPGGIAPGGQYQVTQNPPPGWYPPEEDEIDLADLVGVLYRRKWLIAGVTILFACLAFAATALMTEKYSVNTMMEVGLILTEDGYEKVEGSQAVKNRLKSLAGAVEGHMPESHRDSESGQGDGLGFSVKEDLVLDVPENGTIVGMELSAPRNSDAISFLSHVNQRLIEDHGRIFNQRQVELKNKIAVKTYIPHFL